MADAIKYCLGRYSVPWQEKYVIDAMFDLFFCLFFFVISGQEAYWFFFFFLRRSRLLGREVKERGREEKSLVLSKPFVFRHHPSLGGEELPLVCFGGSRWTPDRNHAPSGIPLAVVSKYP